MGLPEPRAWLCPRRSLQHLFPDGCPQEAEASTAPDCGRPRRHGPAAVGNSLPAQQRSGCIPALSTADLLCFTKNEKNVLNEINSDEPKIS